MNTRIKSLRKSLDLTQAEFSSRLGLTRNYIAQIEIGTKKPSDRTISDICREFNINEEWLRYGIDPMKKDANDDIAVIVDNLLSEDDPFYTLIIGILKTYDKLDAPGKASMNSFIEDLLQNLKREG